jgi:hypothetical protein
MIWLHAYPSPPPRSVSRPATHMKTKKERQLADGRGGGGGGYGGEQGAESYDRKKAWYSVNHSILYALIPSLSGYLHMVWERRKIKKPRNACG